MLLWADAGRNAGRRRQLTRPRAPLWPGLCCCPARRARAIAWRRRFSPSLSLYPRGKDCSPAYGLISQLTTPNPNMFSDNTGGAEKVSGEYGKYNDTFHIRDRTWRRQVHVSDEPGFRAARQGEYYFCESSLFSGTSVATTKPVAERRAPGASTSQKAIQVRFAFTPSSTDFQQLLLYSPAKSLF